MEFTEVQPHILEDKNEIKLEDITQKNLKLNLTTQTKIDNDDEYLGLSPKYQTSIIITEDKRTDSLEKKSTTNSSSNDNNTPSRNDNTFFPNYIPSYNYYQSYYNRKMSSPIMLYYKGFDKYLSDEIPDLKDYIKSSNYIEKESYYNNQYYAYENNSDFKLRTHSIGAINELYFNNKYNIQNEEKSNDNNINNNNIVNNEKIQLKTNQINSKYDFPFYYNNYNECKFIFYLILYR